MDQNQNPQKTPELEVNKTLENTENISSTPEALPTTPESNPEPIIENQPSSVQFEQPVQNIPQTPVADNNVNQNSTSNTVMQNNDQNLVSDALSDKLEMPWIKKAEEIIKKDKENPYQEEEDHEDLQEEYLHKRFGKDLKNDD